MEHVRGGGMREAVGRRLRRESERVGESRGEVRREVS